MSHGRTEIRIKVLDGEWPDREPLDPDIPPGVSLSTLTEEHYTLDGSDAIWLVVNFGSSVGASVVAAYIFKYLEKHRAKRIRVDREEITYNCGIIEKIVRTKLDISEH